MQCILDPRMSCNDAVRCMNINKSLHVLYPESLSWLPSCNSNNANISKDQSTAIKFIPYAFHENIQIPLGSQWASGKLDRTVCIQWYIDFIVNF